INIGNIDTSTAFAGRNAGSVTLTADHIVNPDLLGADAQKGIISVGNINAAGYFNANGGNILLDSGKQEFHMGSLVTRSTTGTNVSSYANDTGSGTAGQLLFAAATASGFNDQGILTANLRGGAGFISLNP